MNIEEQFVEKLGEYNYDECKKILSSVSPNEQKKLIEDHLIGTDWIPNGVINRDIMNDDNAEEFLTYLEDTATQLGVDLDGEFNKGTDIVEIIQEHPELDLQEASEMAFDEYYDRLAEKSEKSGPFVAPTSAVRGDDYIDYSHEDYRPTPEQIPQSTTEPTVQEFVELPQQQQIEQPTTEPIESMEQGRIRK